jgi:hypothetical protein
MLMVPSLPTVGSPDVAPVPAEEATPFSTVPGGVLVPVPELAPAPAPPPRSLPNAPPVLPVPVVPPVLPPPSRPPSARLAVELVAVELVAAAVPAAPTKFEMALAASTGPPPSVRPRAEALLVPSSFWRIIEVSASAPQPGVAQSRGVPSMTRWDRVSRRYETRDRGEEYQRDRAWSRRSLLELR